MSNKCADQSDVCLMKRVYCPKGSCGCDCDNQRHGMTPMGYQCENCGHLQRTDF